MPPVAGTVQNRGAPLGAHVAREVANITDFPSGVQPCTVSPPGCQVSRFGSPPSAGTTYTSVLPLYSALNAIHLPSGENFGFVVAPWKLVSRRAMPPARSTVQMLLAYANATCVALTVGVRSSRVGAAATGGAGDAIRTLTNANAQTAVMRTRLDDMEPSKVSAE